jgi:putative hydrolase of the HAD superfamily
VLVFPNWDRVSAIFARRGIDVAADVLRAVEPFARFALDTADTIAASTDADRGGRYFRMVLEGAGVPASSAREAALADVYAYHTEHNLWEHVPEDVVPALEALRARGLTLAVASNANGVLQRMFDRVGLTPHFHAVCDSCVEGVEKPDPAFFRIVLARCGGTPASAVHVGDLYHVDVVGARAAGLRAVLLDPHGLYADRDVERIRTLADLVRLLDAE